MTENELFEKYLQGGNYALPYLLEFSTPDYDTLRFAGTNEDIEYNGNTYEAASFEYTPPDTQGSGGNLKISGLGNKLINFVEYANENWRLDVVAAIAENGNVTAIKQYHHFFGSVSYGNDMELNFELSGDDRLSMTFPPYKFDSDTNRGNA